MIRMARFFAAILSLVAVSSNAQDTFSILAFDSVTREVGAAGASCVDLSATPYNDHFIAELFPDTGAVVTQAAYIPANQAAARARMRQGDSPQQMMAWLAANIPSPEIRQFGAVKRAHPSAAYTGTACIDFKNHVIGPNYTIQGNILLGQQVLDSMEARFNRESGDLACKLMAAMQGARMPGADTRCASNNSSSLFAFLKVALPSDTFGKPSLLVSLRTQHGDSIEPVDSLQKLFDLVRSCIAHTLTAVMEPAGGSIGVFPDPAHREVVIDGPGTGRFEMTVTDIWGRILFRQTVGGRARIRLPEVVSGPCLLTLEQGGRVILWKKVIFSPE